MQIQSELKSKLSEIEGHLLQGTTAGDVTGAKYDIIWRIILQKMGRRVGHSVLPPETHEAGP